MAGGCGRTDWGLWWGFEQWRTRPGAGRGVVKQITPLGSASSSALLHSLTSFDPLPSPFSTILAFLLGVFAYFTGAGPLLLFPYSFATAILTLARALLVVAEWAASGCGGRPVWTLCGGRV